MIVTATQLYIFAFINDELQECVFVSRQKRRLFYFRILVIRRKSCVAAMELSVLRAQAPCLRTFYCVGE